MTSLRLDCLGSANAYSHGRYWSGFLAGQRVLLDCPPQALPHLVRLGVEARTIDLVLLTHLHSDHIGGMDLLVLAAMQHPDPEAARMSPLGIAGPPGTYERLREIIGPSERLPAPDDERAAWFEQRGGASFEWAGAKVSCLEMDHDPNLVALGYRVELDGRIVAYTGDTRRCKAVEELADGADLLIAECGIGPHHMDWDDIRGLRAALAPSTRLLVTHYDPRSVPPDLAAIEGIELAEDFASYEV